MTETHSPPRHTTAQRLTPLRTSRGLPHNPPRSRETGRQNSHQPPHPFSLSRDQSESGAAKRSPEGCKVQQRVGSAPARRGTFGALIGGGGFPGAPPSTQSFHTPPRLLGDALPERRAGAVLPEVPCALSF